MKRASLAILFLMLVAAPAAAQQACMLQRFVPAPEAVQLPPNPAQCSVGHCATVPNVGRVCKCESSRGDAMLIERPGSWTARPTIVVSGATRGFEVLVGSVDGRPDDELVIADHIGTDPLRGTTNWRIDILRAPFDNPNAIGFFVAEYGPGTFQRRRDGRPGCEILASEWRTRTERNVEIREFFGAAFQIAGGVLSPIRDRGVLRRRLDTAFVAEVAADRDGPIGQPARWLRAGVAATIRPERPPGLTDIQRIFRDEVDRDRGGERIIVLDLRGRRSSYSIDPRGREALLNRLGDYDSGILYPMGYWPALTGMRARVQRGQQNVLWLERR